MAAEVKPLKVLDRPARPDVYNARPNGLMSLFSGSIVLHHTGGTNSLEWLRGGNGVSCNKLFARNGTIYKIVADKYRSWHAGTSEYGGRRDWNSFSLGYEIENRGNGEAYTDAQYEAVSQSVAYDCSLYHIADRWVQSHAAVALPRGRKTDPKGWDWPRMWRRVDEIRGAWPEFWQIPLWFDDNGQRRLGT